MNRSRPPMGTDTPPGPGHRLPVPNRSAWHPASHHRLSSVRSPHGIGASGLRLQGGLPTHPTLRCAVGRKRQKLSDALSAIRAENEAMCCGSKTLTMRCRFAARKGEYWVLGVANGKARWLLSFQRHDTKARDAHWSMKPRPLAVRPEELRAIRRAFCRATRLGDGSEGSRIGLGPSGRRRGRCHEAGSSDLPAPNGGYLT